MQEHHSPNPQTLLYHNDFLPEHNLLVIPYNADHTGLLCIVAAKIWVSEKLSMMSPSDNDFILKLALTAASTMILFSLSSWEIYRGIYQRFCQSAPIE